MRVTEQGEAVNVGVALICDDFVDMVDLAAVRWSVTAGILAIAIPGDHRKTLHRGWFASGTTELEWFAMHVVERVTD